MTDPLSKLPLFATDDEIAIAIVGKKRASEWKRGALRILEARGFPRFDALHGGRPVPLIRTYYNGYFGITAGFAAAVPDGEERLGERRKSRRENRADRKPQLGLNYRCRDALIYLVAHPDRRTYLEIPGAGALTMAKLEEKGAIVAKGKDRDGDTLWQVTELGIEEVKRIQVWHHGANNDPR